MTAFRGMPALQPARQVSSVVLCGIADGGRIPMAEGRELIARAGEAVQRVRSLGRADGPLLEPVLAAVLKETARNRFRAAALLAGLTTEFAEARAAVSVLAADPRAHVRRRAMRCLGRDTPRTFAADILRAGQVDTDSAVRMKAASMAGFLGLTELLQTGYGAEPGAAEVRPRE
jgi:hypothetical protein